MLPIWQTCPKCHERFEGSDVIGDPCPACMGFDPIIMQQAIKEIPDGR